MDEPTAIPPIDPSIAATPAPDAQWIPPWLAQTPTLEQQHATPPPPAEIQMPDDFVGGPAPQQAQGQAPWSVTPDVHPDAIPNAPPPWLAQAQHDQAAPKLGAVDYALSQELGEPTSTGENPADALHKIATDPQATVADRQLAWKQMSAEDRTNFVNTADPKQLAMLATAAMSPEELGTVAVRHQQALIHQQSADNLTASVLADMQARRDADAYAAAITHANAETDAIAKDAADIANTKIVTPGGAAFTVFSMIGGALGQLASHGAGSSSNSFMDGLNHGIEQSIALQKDEIQNRWKGLDVRKNMVAEQFQRSGDMYRAQEVVRIAHYDSMIKQAQIAAQNFDPNGTTALQIAQQTQQIQAARGAALQATNQTLLKNKFEQQKLQNESDTLKQTIKHQNAETSIAYGHLDIDRSKDARDQKAFDMENAPVTPEQARLENPGLPDAAYPTVPVSRKQLKTTLEAFKSGQELQGKATENAQKQASGQVLDGAGKPYLNAAGKPVQINPEVAKDLNERVGGGQAYIDEMSEVKRMLAADPSTFDREKWAKLNSHLETAAASWTQLYGAKASSRELEAAKEVVGANYEGYASRVKDKGTGIAAIGAQIDSTKRNLNTQLKRRAGITGGADLIDTSNPPPTVETPEDKLTKTLSTNYAKVAPESLDSDDQAFVQIAKGTDNPKITAGYVNEHFSPVLNRALQTGIAPAQQRALDALQAAARGSDPDARKKALEVLGAVSGANKDQDGNRASATGANANVRAAAKAIIDESSADAMGSILDTAMPAEEPGTGVR